MSEENYSRFMFVPILLIAVSLFIIGFRIIGTAGADTASAGVETLAEDSGTAESGADTAAENSETADSGADTAAEDSAKTSADGGTSGAETQSGSSAEGAPVDINRATAQELTALDGIGEKAAEAIVETRVKMGGFRSVSDILCADGVGEATLEKLRPRLTVSKYSGEMSAEERAAKNGGVVNINTASREELMTLDGIGAKKADAIITLREETGGFSTAHDIVRVSGIGEATYEKLKDKICVE